MSYALSVASDAATVLAELPLEVQEDVWDLLEGIATEPRSPGATSGLSASVHKYYHTAAAPRLLIEFILVVDDAARLVFVARLEYVTP